MIRTQELLDHETTPHYWLTVYATDQGVVPLSSFVEVYVQVQDVNDNAPQTLEPIYFPSVLENSPKNVSVIQVQAWDPDTSSQNKLTYKITSGNPQGFFDIDPKTGESSFSLGAQLGAGGVSGLKLFPELGGTTVATWETQQHQDVRLKPQCLLDGAA